MLWLINIKGHFIMIFDPYTSTAPIVREPLSSVLPSQTTSKGDCDITGITGTLFCHRYYIFSNVN